MIGLFRSFLNTRAARLFFVVLLVPFVMWGIADVARNMGAGGALATVGSRTVDPAEFQAAYRQQMARLDRLMGNKGEPTPEMRRGAAAQTLDQLITEAALAGEASRLGIAVPDAALVGAIQDMPEFRGPGGKFDRAAYDAVLRQNNLIPRQFEERMRAGMAERQVLDTVGAGAEAPTVLADRIFAFQRETRTLDTVELPLTAAPEPAEPTEAELRAAYADDPGRYSAPAFRRVKLVVLSPETVAKTIEVSDADIDAYYDAHKTEFGHPEQRSVQAIVAPNEAVAARLAAQWKAGADWAAMQKAAAEAGATAAQIDDATRDTLPGTELADAAFAAAPDTVSGPVATAFGADVFKVTAVTPSTEQPLDAVKDQVKARIARDRAADEVYDRSTRLEDALAADGLDKIPDDIGASLLGGTLDAQGNTEAGAPAPIPGSPALRQAILQAAFAAPLNEVPHLVEGPDHSYYALTVESETPPETKPFEAVQAQVRDNWLHDARRRAQEEVAAKLLTEVNGGKSLDDAATLAGLRAERSPPIPRDGNAEGVPPAVARAAFALRPHEATMVETPDGFVVLQVAEVTTPPPSSDPVMLAQLRTVLGTSLGRDTIAVFANGVRMRARPTVNQAMLNSLVQ